MKKIIFFILFLFLFMGKVHADDFFNITIDGPKEAHIGDTFQVHFKTDKELYYYSGNLMYEKLALKVIDYKIDNRFNDLTSIDEEEDSYFIKAENKIKQSNNFQITVTFEVLDCSFEYTDVGLIYNSGIFFNDSPNGYYDLSGQESSYRINIENNYTNNKNKYIYGSIGFGMIIFFSAIYIVFIKKIEE